MAFIDKNVVYAHCVKIHCIVFPAVDFHAQFLQFGRKVLFPFLQPFLHFAAAVTHGGLLQHFKAALRVGEFFGENIYHGLFRLGNFTELVVCEDNTVPVVVLDFGEHLLAVGRGEILLARIENLCHRVRLAESLCYLVYVGFQSYNERFLHQPEAFHFVGCHAHNHRLSRADFVPANSTSVLLNHPDSVLLRGVEFIIRELFKGQSRKGLRRTVIGWTHIAVETLVVHPYQFVPYFHGLVVEPTVETLPNLLYLACGFLYGFFVRNTHRLPVTVNLFRQFRHGVVQGVYKQVLAVAAAHGIGVVGQRGISLQAHYIGVVHIEIHHLGFRLEKFGGEVGVQLRVYPPLTHIDVEFLVRYRFGRGLFKSLYGGFRPLFLAVREVLQAGDDVLAFGYDVSGEELALVFPLSADGIVEYLVFQCADDFFFGHSRNLPDIVHIYMAVKVQAARQCLVGCQLPGRVNLLECHGLTHDVGLEDVPAELHFNREHFRTETVKHDKLLVVVVVKTAPFGYKGIV